MYSISEENYLKAILALSSDQSGQVNTNQLAKRLETKASSITDMVQKLHNKGLVHYEKYKGVSLTETGQQVALSIIRKHRLWEVFLVNKLNFSWDEVHEIAEQLEHVQSAKLVTRLDAFLGFPVTDPHGDPIPDDSGHIRPIKRQVLAKVPNGSFVVLAGSVNSTDDFLRYLDKRGLVLGDKLEVTGIEAYDHSMSLLKQNKLIIISEAASNNLLVKIDSHD